MLISKDVSVFNKKDGMRLVTLFGARISTKNGRVYAWSRTYMIAKSSPLSSIAGYVPRNVDVDWHRSVLHTSVDSLRSYATRQAIPASDYNQDIYILTDDFYVIRKLHNLNAHSLPEVGKALSTKRGRYYFHRGEFGNCYLGDYDELTLDVRKGSLWRNADPKNPGEPRA